MKQTINHKQNTNEKGSAAVVILVLLVVVAAGALGFMAGKKGLIDTDSLSGKVDMALNSSKESNDAYAIDPEKNPVVVKVGEEQITRQEVLDMMNQMPPQLRQQIPVEQLLPMAIEQVVGNAVIDMKVAEAKLDDDAQVQERLANAKEQILRERFLEQEIDARTTEEKLKAAYDEYVANYPKVEEVKASHILVDEEQVAKDIIARLGKGEDFAALAKEFSKDGTAEDGGDLGYFAKQEVVPEFGEVAFSLKNGEYTKKPVKSDYGYHVIKVEEKRVRPAAEFAEMEKFLKQQLQGEVVQEALAEWKEGIEIERFDITGKPVAQSEPAAGDAAEDEAAPAAEEAQSAPADAAAAAEEAPAEEASE